MKKSAFDATQLLKSQGLRRTPQRLQLIETLSRQKKPLSAEELHRGLKSAACDLATVYRNLLQLEEKGLVLKTFFSDQIARYSLSSPQSDHGHAHHIECRKCHQLTPLDLCVVEQQIKSLEKMGFRSITHRLEFSADCPSCQAS